MKSLRTRQEKKDDIILSLMTKSSIPTENSQKQSDNTKTPPTSSIIQLSVVVSSDIQVVCLTGLLTSHSPQQLGKSP